MLGAQALDFIVDVTGLHRAAAGAVDAQDHTLGVFILESRLQAGHDFVGTRRAAWGDHAADIDQRGMAALSCIVFVIPAHADEQQRKQVQQHHHLEKHAPLPRATLFLNRRQRHFLQYAALPLGVTRLLLRHIISFKNNSLQQILRLCPIYTRYPC